MNKIKIMSCFGTRPEAIKMAPLVKILEKDENIEHVLCVTAQHRQMLDQVLESFDIIPDHDLDLMKERQTLPQITSGVLTGVDEILKKVKPDILLVQGDTATAFAAALAGFYNKIKVGHVEAGLRTNDMYSPFPEEMNRKLISSLASIHFAPTESNKENLLKEGVSEYSIYVTGNTAIDALKETVKDKYVFEVDALNRIDFNKYRVITLTAHRRENLGDPLYNIVRAVKRIVEKYDDILVVDPVHLNPEVTKVFSDVLGNMDRVMLIPPVGAFDMHNLMARSYLIMTDSGGLQEEAPSLGKPVLVLRTETERPEAVIAGTVKISGIREEEIFNDACLLIEEKERYLKMAETANPYGDGHASERIKNSLLYFCGIIGERPKDWISNDTKEK